MQKFQKDVSRFVKNALNRTIRKCAKEQKELIKKDYALKPKLLKSLTKTTLARDDNLTASIRNVVIKLSINNFKRRANKQGVSVQIAKGKTLFIKGAFLGIRRGGKKNRQ